MKRIVKVKTSCGLFFNSGVERSGESPTDSKMTFNTNQAFKWLIFGWLDYDGENFKKSDFIGSILPYLWFRFWWIASIYNIARYCTLAGLSADKLPVLEFYLGKLDLFKFWILKSDISKLVKFRFLPQPQIAEIYVRWLVQHHKGPVSPIHHLGRSCFQWYLIALHWISPTDIIDRYRLLSLVRRCQFFNLLVSVWLLTTACLFQRLMGEDRRYRYWLRFFQIPVTRSAPRLAGYSKEKLKKFWQFSSSLQSLLLKSMAIQSALLASCFAASYVVEMQRYSNLHSPPIFWTILMVSSTFFSISILLNSYFNLPLPSWIASTS